VRYEPRPGDIVGAKRWPYHAAHPDCWGQPWSGEVLARNDVRAWAGTVVFPSDEPNADEVALHVARHAAVLASELPVLWDFGSYRRVFWERVASLRPYAEDVTEWQATRDAALARCGCAP
jgi:hypothetical protein